MVQIPLVHTLKEETVVKLSVNSRIKCRSNRRMSPKEPEITKSYSLEAR